MASQRAKRQMLHGGRTFSRKKLALSFDNPVEFFSQLGKTIDVSGFLWFAYKTNLQVTNLDTILR